jgi:hypothetical protein
MTMTTEDFLAVDQQAPAKIARDRWQRPLIVPVGGGDPRPYTRASTLGKALDDEAGLTAWKCRMTAVGVAKRRDLILAANAHLSDKKVMGEIVEQAMDAAEAGAAATSGTALHEILDAYEQGHTPYIPDEYRSDVEAYLTAIRGLEFVRSETFVVDDELEVAGTYDNLWRLKHHATTPDGTVLKPGELILGDKKTGADIRYGHASWSVQLSTYAHGLRYDPATNTRLDPEPINKDWGLIVHVPVMKGTAQLLWIDLRKGRELARLAHTVRDARKTKTMTPAEIAPTWADQIAATTRLDVLRALWGSCTEEQAMTPEIEAAFKSRAKELAA